MSAYREAPPETVWKQPPRASWWRRLWARGIEERLNVRRHRQAFHRMYPEATWAQCQNAAKLVAAIVDGPRDPTLSMLDVQLATMGPRSPWPVKLPLPHAGTPVRR